MPTQFILAMFYPQSQLHLHSCQCSLVSQGCLYKSPRTPATNWQCWSKSSCGQHWTQDLTSKHPWDRGKYFVHQFWWLNWRIFFWFPVIFAVDDSVLLTAKVDDIIEDEASNDKIIFTVKALWNIRPNPFSKCHATLHKGWPLPKWFYFNTTCRTILMIIFHLMPFLSHWVNTNWNRTAIHIIWNRVHKWELLRWLFVFKKWLDGQRLNWHFIIHYLRVGAPFADQNLWWITLICENGKGNCCRKKILKLIFSNSISMKYFEKLKKKRFKKKRPIFKTDFYNQFLRAMAKVFLVVSFSNCLFKIS